VQTKDYCLIDSMHQPKSVCSPNDFLHAICVLCVISKLVKLDVFFKESMKNVSIF